ncbi:MAG: hypothetical protein RLZZ53_3070 [Acidobacteriota bacterium]|jgi:mono/diheme cytochrome c family protein
MRLKNIVWTAALIVSAVLLTALISTATVGAEDAGGVAEPKTVSGNAAGDPAKTGLGDWTVEEFIATMKTGRERGKGRPVMPPMPVQNLAALSDPDIRALFAYLQSLPAIKNRTPQLIEPAEPK